MKKKFGFNIARNTFFSYHSGNNILIQEMEETKEKKIYLPIIVRDNEFRFIRIYYYIHVQ